LLTVIGTVLGSPLYMSPEQAMGAEGIDGRTDVFAFGGILFEALSGQRAFDAPNFNALIVTIATKQPKGIDETAPTLPETLRALVRECMVTDKTKRLASFDAVSERLTAMLPELTALDIRLPSPYGTERPSDPDATNALPVMRKSDRPPASGGQPASLSPQAVSAQQPSPPGAPPSPVAMITTPSAKAPSTKSTEVAGGWLGNAEAYVRRLPPRTLALAAGAGGTALLVLVILGMAAAFARGGGNSQGAVKGSVAASTTTAVLAASTSEPPPKLAMSSVPSADDSSEVPTFSVDSLPVATRGAPSKGNGRLSIAAAPGRCTVSVDGVQRGVTPLTTFELPAGSHRVECAPPGGRTRTVSVNVAEGTATRYKFALDE
jgi:serine/threonine-protein kinase